MTTNIYAKIPAEAIDIAEANLNKSEFRVWLYLWKVDAFGDKMRVFPNPEKIAKDLNLHKRTIDRACETLEDLGLFTFRIQEWQGINHYGSKSEQAKKNFAQKIQVVTEPNSGCCDSAVQNLTALSNFGQNDPNRDSAVQKMTERSNFGQDCQNQGSKVASANDSNLSNNSLITINNSLINTGNKIQNEIQEREENFQNFEQEADRKFRQEETTVDFSEKADRKFGQEETTVDFSEKADRKFGQEETTVESVATTLKIVQESLNQNDLHKEDLKTETKPKSEDKVVDLFSAAAPKVFSNLRDFVVCQAKQDPKINNPEIWADTVIRRNPDDWRIKWDAWEKARSQTTTYTPPKIEISSDPEVRRKAVEEARKLLPEWMRRNRA